MVKNINLKFKLKTNQLYSGTHNKITLKIKAKFKEVEFKYLKEECHSHLRIENIRKEDIRILEKFIKESFREKITIINTSNNQIEIKITPYWKFKKMEYKIKVILDSIEGIKQGEKRPKTKNCNLEYLEVPIDYVGDLSITKLKEKISDMIKNKDKDIYLLKE